MSAMRNSALLKEKEVQRARNDDANDRFPAEMLEHEKGSPIPRRGNHQDRGRGEMGQRAANGNVHEKQPDRPVGEQRLRIQTVEFFRKQHGGDRHRGRLGDERSKNRRNDEHAQPPRGRRVLFPRKPQDPSLPRRNAGPDGWRRSP